MFYDRKTCLVQYIAVEPLTFYATADGTDLIQEILRKHLAREESKIVGQEGSLSIDEHEEFLTFEPTDTKNRIINLPIEHLAYSGALRRMKEDKNDPRNPDQIQKRQFENVHLANRYPQDIIGPSIFAAIFHGFDNALCYLFVTQSADDACLMVMKLMRAFRLHEQQQQQQQQQGQSNQGPSNQLPSSVSSTHENPLDQLPSSSHSFVQENRQLFVPSATMFQQDDFMQNLFANSNVEIINQPSSMYYSQPPQNFVTPGHFNMPFTNSTTRFLNEPVSFLTRPASPSFHGLSPHAFPPQVIYRPNNQEINYKQNIFVRWLKPPTPPPSAPIIVREIQAPPIVQPPLIYRHIPPPPPTPPPIVVREQPPPCPCPEEPLIIEKHLPPACLPRQVLVESCPPPPCKPQTLIYEKYLPQPAPPPRQVIVQRDCCQPRPATTCCTTTCQSRPATTCPPTPCRRLVREVVRQVPTCAPQPALICNKQTQRTVSQGQSQVVQQLVPVFAQRQRVVQPKGLRIIRQVIGPAQTQQTVPMFG